MKKLLYILCAGLLVFGLTSCSLLNINDDLGCLKVVLVEPEPEPEPVVVEEPIVEVIPVTTTTITEMVLFDYDESGIRADQRVVIENVAGYIAEYPDTIIVIIGHASEEGTGEYNLVLSEKRCGSVYDALLAEGVSAENIENMIARGETTTFGAELPPNRVVLIITEE